MTPNLYYSDTGTATSIDLHDSYEDTDTVTVTDSEGVTVEYIPAGRDLFEVAHRISRKRKFLVCGIIEVYDVWWNDDVERYYWRLVYARVPIGDRRAGICRRKVNIVRRSKHRGRHWDRKSA